ncbi:HTH domain-containing protein [Methanolobus sp. WCC1]|uniref:HTH domain-containing protein n=1 Tax=unclassified Methanolobus TaxID=2629569 RepID=UPI0032467C53
MKAYKNIDKNQSMADIAYEILKISKEEMFYKDIWKIMEQDVGYVSQGISPETSLNSVLGRDLRFRKNRGYVQLSEWLQKDNGDEESVVHIQCGVCEKMVQSDFNYCPYCQSKFQTTIVCQNCDKELKNYQADWVICPYCGEELPDDPELIMVSKLKKENEEEDDLFMHTITKKI